MNTGIKKLDELLGELDPGQLVLVGASPSTGKSSFAHNVVMRNVLGMVPDGKKHKVGLYSTGVDEESVCKRLLTAYLEDRAFKPRLKKIHRLDETAQAEYVWRVLDAMEAFQDGQFCLIGDDGLCIDDMCEEIPEFVREGGEMVIIDDTQRLRTQTLMRSDHDRQGYIVEELVKTAKECQIPIILLANVWLGNDRQESNPSLRHFDFLNPWDLARADTVVLINRRRESVEEDVVPLNFHLLKHPTRPLGKVEVPFARKIYKLLD